MKRFELPEMNISMFDAESITMASGVSKAVEALNAAGASDVEVTQWKDWNVTV